MEALVETRTHTVEITGEDIRKAFNLPADAEIEFIVPGGGDWSHCGIGIDKDHPIQATWKVVKEE